ADQDQAGRQEYGDDDDSRDGQARRNPERSGTPVRVVVSVLAMMVMMMRAHVCESRSKSGVILGRRKGIPSAGGRAQIEHGPRGPVDAVIDEGERHAGERLVEMLQPALEQECF